MADDARPLGALLDRVDDPYQNELVSSLKAAARARGVSMICFLGGAPGQHGHSDPREHVFDLAAYARLRGAVVVSATLGTHAGRSAPLGIASRLKPLPLVSIGTALAGLPAVLLDNQEGMRELVSHLIEVHGKRAIALIRGPELNDEAQDRYCGYVRALSEHEQTLEPKRILSGAFDRASGARAVAELLERGVPFDALVAANDLMALGAIDELRRRDIDVPGTIAVAGFDDLYEAQFGACSLTSMRQPIQDLAARALEVLLESGVRRSSVLPTKLVCRRSCGCGHSGLSDRPATQSGEHTLPLLHRRGELVGDLRALLAFADDGEWAEDLFVSFVADARGKTQGAFMEQVQAILERLAAEQRDLALAYQIVDVFRRAALPALTALPGMLLRAEKTLYGAGALIADALRSDSERHGISLHDSSHVLGAIAQELTLRVGLESVLTTLERHLPKLGIPGAGLALFRRPELAEQSWSDLEWLWTYGSERSQWWRNHKPLRAHNGQPYFAVAVPLAFDGKLLGLASFEVGPSDGVVFETLRALLSSALAHASRSTRPTSRPSALRAIV